MKYGIIWSNPFYWGGALFNPNHEANRDDCLYHWQVLRAEYRKLGIELVTQEACPEKPLFIIFNGFPISYGDTGLKWDNYKFGIDPTIPLYLVLWECEIIEPQGWKIYDHRNFDKIFSWFHWWGKDKYIQFRWPQKYTPMYKGDKTKHLCIISGNKTNYDYRELYTERLNAVKYFGDRIDVYGRGFKTIENKFEVLKDYKYAICYENARDIPGYVTEKIWDCYKAGTIPIYLGDDTHNLPCIRKEKLSYKQLDDLINDGTYYQHLLSQIESELETNFPSAQDWAKTIMGGITIK